MPFLSNAGPAAGPLGEVAIDENGALKERAAIMEYDGGLPRAEAERGRPA